MPQKSPAPAKRTRPVAALRRIAVVAPMASSDNSRIAGPAQMRKTMSEANGSEAEAGTDRPTSPAMSPIAPAAAGSGAAAADCGRDHRGRTGQAAEEPERAEGPNGRPSRSPSRACHHAIAEGD